MPTEPAKEKPKKSLNNYSEAQKYSGIAAKMIAIILLGVAFGSWLDKQLPPENLKLYTIILSIVSVFLSMYVTIREFMKK